MIDLYLPEGIGEEYRYILPSNNNYYDLYNTNDLQVGNIYTFYRVYYGINEDLVELRTEEYLGINSVIEINPKSNFIYRKDFTNILVISFVFIFAMVILVNIMTSLIRKGGLLSGLF